MVLQARPVDPRDVDVEVDEATFRVHFWRTTDLACREFEVTGADVEEVLAWAERNRRGHETCTVGVLTVTSGLGGPDVVLTRIHGTDPSRSTTVGAAPNGTAPQTSRPDEGRVWRTPEGCVICAAGEPLDVIAELETCWVTAGADAPLPGYVCVVARRHHEEPFEMPADERARFWDEAMAVAAAIAGVVRPIKMNYEIHGNTVPHLHLHLFPRYPDDPYVGGPIDPRRASFTRSGADLDRLRAAVRASRTPERGASGSAIADQAPSADATTSAAARPER